MQEIPKLKLDYVCIFSELQSPTCKNFNMRNISTDSSNGNRTLIGYRCIPYYNKHGRKGTDK